MILRQQNNNGQQYWQSVNTRRQYQKEICINLYSYTEILCNYLDTHTYSHMHVHLNIYIKAFHHTFKFYYSNHTFNECLISAVVIFV